MRVSWWSGDRVRGGRAPMSIGDMAVQHGRAYAKVQPLRHAAGRMVGNNQQAGIGAAGDQFMSVGDHRSAIYARRPESDSMKKRRLQAAESLPLGKTSAGTQASTADVETANYLKSCEKPVTGGEASRRDDATPQT